MTNPSATSPFMKTAFLAIALAASSMSSAAHAGDFIATMTTQGLSTLSLDAPPGFTEFVEGLENGVCKVTDEKLKQYIEYLKSRLTTLKNERQPITDLEKEIEKLTNEIARVNQLLSGSVPEFTRKQNEEKLAKLRKERDEKKAALEEAKKANPNIDDRIKIVEELLKTAEAKCKKDQKKPAQAQ